MLCPWQQMRGETNWQAKREALENEEEMMCGVDCSRSRNLFCILGEIRRERSTGLLFGCRCREEMLSGAGGNEGERIREGRKKYREGQSSTDGSRGLLLKKDPLTSKKNKD